MRLGEAHTHRHARAHTQGQNKDHLCRSCLILSDARAAVVMVTTFRVLGQGEEEEEVFFLFCLMLLVPVQLFVYL